MGYSMNFKSTCILFAILVAVLALFFVAQWLGKNPGDVSAYVLPSLVEEKLKVTDIDTMELQVMKPKPYKLVFTRADKGWRINEPDVRADGLLVNQLIDEAMKARSDEDAEVSGKLAEYGLDQPSAILTLKGKKDRTWELKIGKVSFGLSDAVIYVSSSDRPKEVLAVRRDMLSGLFRSSGQPAGDDKIPFKEFADFRTRELLGASADSIEYVRLQDGKHPSVTLVKTGGTQWNFKEPFEGEADSGSDAAPSPPRGTSPAPGGLQVLLTALAGTRVESESDFVTDNARSLAEYGLDAKSPERILVTVLQRISGHTDQMDQPGQGPETILIGKKVDGKDMYYACLAGENYVVKVPGTFREQIIKVLDDPNLLRSRDLVRFNVEQQMGLDYISIKTPAGSFQLRKKGQSWELLDPSVRPAEAVAIRELLVALAERGIVKRLVSKATADAALGLDKEDVAVSLWVDGLKNRENKENSDKPPAPLPEPRKENEPTVKLVFGNKLAEQTKDQGVVYVRRIIGKDSVRLAVPAKILDKVMQGKLTYLDRTLPGFAENDVTKLVIVRGNTIFEFYRGPKAVGAPSEAKWQPKQAAESTDPKTADDVLSILNNLRAEKFVAELAGEAELAGFGLSLKEKKFSAEIRLTLTKGGKPEERTYLIGNETAEKAGFYARQGENESVFIVPKALIEDLLQRLDRTSLFTFDPDKVRKVKLTGWALLRRYAGYPGDRTAGSRQELESEQSARLQGAGGQHNLVSTHRGGPQG